MSKIIEDSTISEYFNQNDLLEKLNKINIMDRMNLEEVETLLAIAVRCYSICSCYPEVNFPALFGEVLGLSEDDMEKICYRQLANKEEEGGSE